MKVLSLTQPWATLVAIGAKQVETRSWPTNHRGSLAIHAAKGWTLSDRWLVQHDEAFRDMLRPAGYVKPEDLPLGCVVAVCEVQSVRSTNNPDFLRWLSFTERHFGNYGPDRYGWVLVNIKPLPTPIPAKGHLGLWDWEAPDEVQMLTLPAGWKPVVAPAP